MAQKQEKVDKQLLQQRIQQIIRMQCRSLQLENIGAAWRLRRVPDFHPPITSYGGFYFDKYKKCIFAFTCDTDVGDWEDYAEEYIVTSWHNPDPVVPYQPPEVRERYSKTNPRPRKTGYRKRPPGEATYIPGHIMAEEIQELLGEGMTQADIARKFEVSQAYISTVKKKYLTTS